MTGAERTLLAVDLEEEPGRTFRVPPGSFHDVSADLAIANLSSYDVADAADDTGGTLRD